MEPTWNTLVVGDNLLVLPILAEESIDLVYLDPPYNTGNGFAYADRFRPADGRRAGRHTAWLEMMRPRLVQAHRLMTMRGALFCSIDDNEVAYLRLLLDEIFGEQNFVAQLVVNLNPKGRQLGAGFATSHEYVLVYARSRAECALDATSTEGIDPADFPLTAPDGRAYRHLPLRNTNKKFNPTTAPTLHYPLYGDPESGRVATDPFDGAEQITPVFGDGAPAVWRWSAPLVMQRPDDLVCRRIRGRRGPRVDLFQKDWLHPERRKKLRTVWTSDEVGSTDTAAAELKALIGSAFESPKPTGLLRRIIATMPSDARVLDCFAGSGTTGHAVALLNAADGGTRHCLSINIDEPTRSGSRADAAGFALVSDVTRARLEAVADTIGGRLEVLTAADPASVTSPHVEISRIVT